MWDLSKETCSYEMEEKITTLLPPSPYPTGGLPETVFPGEVGTSCFYICKTKSEALSKKSVG